jgi:hypothetical protein
MAQLKAFKDLKVGDKFGCWGDVFANYKTPVWIECVKVGEQTAREINGISFLIDKESEVSIEIKSN